MKQIGYTSDRKTWSNLQAPLAVSIYIHENNEKINTGRWEHIGWIYPAEAVTKSPPYCIVAGERPSTNSVAVYIERQRETTPTDAERIDALVKRLEALEQFSEQVDKALELFAKQLANNRELDHIPPVDAMTFYDHAFIAAYCSAPSMTTTSAHAIAHMLTVARRPATGA